ncbi:MAG: arginine--tRNA ligase [Pyrinomonadaceae bacterium]
MISDLRFTIFDLLSYTFCFVVKRLFGRNNFSILKSLDLQTIVRERLRQAAQEQFGISLEQIASEIPPRNRFGDLAFPVAFELAKRIKQQTGEKRNPRDIAETLREALTQVEAVAKVEVAGAGYLNVFYNRATFLAQALGNKKLGTQDVERGTRLSRVIVEHTSINPNKAAHLGHLRNAILGDTFVRILRATGENVQVQNYIDNTGVQVADVVVGLLHIEQFTHAEARRKIESLTVSREATLPDSKATPLDYYCWDLYARVGVFYRRGGLSATEDPEMLKLRAEVLHALEEGNNETATLADFLATKVVECHLNTMERLDIRYDVLPRESEILHLHFWDAAFVRLKEIGAIRLETEGKHAGCWVMPFESHTGTDEHEADKIIVRSNGTVTYAGKDIAYQLWKLGRLGLDFKYRQFRQDPHGRLTWITTSENSTPHAALGTQHSFGNAEKVYNVIDSRQAYTQEVVKRGVAATAPDIGEAASVHLAYEMVALSPAACEELGLVLSSEERARPYIEMSGRRGLGVKADDLINQLETCTLVEVAARHADLSDEEKLKTAHMVAVGALRYFLLKWTRNSVIAFDFKEALSFEGETGPYCQYAAVRANSIFRKLDEAAMKNAAQFVQAQSNATEITRVFESETGDDLWSLVTLAARLDEALQTAAATCEPSNLAKYAFQLARAFNAFYNDKRNRILEEKDAARRAVLISIAELTRTQLTNTLATLGIEVPERM